MTTDIVATRTDFPVEAEGLNELDAPGMSNCGHEVDEGAEDYLRNGGISRHAAWNFNGRLAYLGGKFVEEVWCYHSVVGYAEAETLRDLMSLVNDEWGWD